MPQLDVVSGRASSLKADRLADHEGNGFGFGFANLLGRKRATLAAMQHFMREFVRPGSSVILPPWDRPFAGTMRSE